MHWTLNTLMIIFFSIIYQQAVGQTNNLKTTYTELGSPMPNIQILLLDSKTQVETQTIHNNLPTVILYFSPECEHCGSIADSIVKNVHLFDSVNLCMLSLPNATSDIYTFALKHYLLDYEQITVGQDIEFSFLKFFNVNSVPSAIVYNKDKKLLANFKELNKFEHLKNQVKNIYTKKLK